jgi:hypothetical protein
MWEGDEKSREVDGSYFYQAELLAASFQPLAYGDGSSGGKKQESGMG